MPQIEAIEKLKNHVTEKHNEFVDSLESVRTIIGGTNVSDELKNKNIFCHRWYISNRIRICW